MVITMVIILMAYLKYYKEKERERELTFLIPVLGHKPSVLKTVITKLL